MRSLTVGFGLATALMLATLHPVTAAPLSIGARALKAAVPSDVIDVNWRYRRWRSGYTSEWRYGYYPDMGGFGYGRLSDRYADIYAYGPPPAYYVEPPSREYREYGYGGYGGNERRYSEPRRSYYEERRFAERYRFEFIPEPYPDPNGPRRQCWISTDRDRGFGYFIPC